MKKFMFSSFMMDMLSGTGNVSSKRVSGMISLMVSLACIVYLVLTEGGTNTVENLLQTVLVMAACLLGVSSVTSIWKTPGGKNANKSDKS